MYHGIIYRRTETEYDITQKAGSTTRYILNTGTKRAVRVSVCVCVRMQ